MIHLIKALTGTHPFEALNMKAIESFQNNLSLRQSDGFVAALLKLNFVVVGTKIISRYVFFNESLYFIFKKI